MNEIHILAIIVAVSAIFIRLYSTTIKGFIGELKVNIKLHLLGSQFVTISNLLIETKDGNTSQIDHIVLSEYGIFVIETKNYKGWIFGNENSEDWQQVIYSEKFYFRNPIKQNKSHIYALKDILCDFPNVKYYPIVVFVGSATLKQISVSSPVIYANDLRATIKQNCFNRCLTIDEVQNIKLRLKSSDVSKNVSRKQHITNIKHNIAEKQFKVNNLICPWCNGKLVLRSGVHGQFYGCSNYPKCKFTKKY